MTDERDGFFPIGNSAFVQLLPGTVCSFILIYIYSVHQFSFSHFLILSRNGKKKIDYRYGCVNAFNFSIFVECDFIHRVRMGSTYKIRLDSKCL